MQTSISDYEKYKNLCLLASKNDEVFSIFRSHADYVGILEHVSYESGNEYLKEIKKVIDIDDDIVRSIKKVDEHGGPIRYSFGKFGSISPTMLRYLHVLADIKRLYGDLSGKVIVEIGAGYGGQSAIINLMYNIKEYIIIDLPETIELIKKFLITSGLDLNKYKFYTLENLIDIDSDFLISNYAFSECYKNIQDVYMEKVVNRATNFYMAVNFISEELVYSKEELLQKLKGNIIVSKEKPLTRASNLLFYKG